MPPTLPRTAVALKDKATEHGWDVEVLDSPAATEGELVVLRLRRDGELMLGIWHHGKFRRGIGFGRLGGRGPRIPTTGLGAREITAVVAS